MSQSLSGRAVPSARLPPDGDATKADAGTTEAPNAYAAAEIRDAGRIYTDAGSSSDPTAARRLALALALDGQARQQPGIDPAFPSKIENDTLAAVKATPAC